MFSLSLKTDRRRRIMGEIGIFETAIDAYYDLDKMLAYYDDYEDTEVDNAPIMIQFCYQKVINIGFVLLLIVQIPAAFVFFKIFKKSLRFYSMLKCLIVAMISVCSLTVNYLVHISDKQDFVESQIYKYRSYFDKALIFGKFFTCNLSFLFMHDIYKMICSSLHFSSEFILKLLLALIFAFLPIASTFRYNVMTGNEDIEEFCLETFFRLTLFFFILFFAYKVREQSMISRNLRSNEQETNQTSRNSNDNENKFRKINIFFICMAVLHVCFMAPSIFLFCVQRMTVSGIDEENLEPEHQLQTQQYLSCISYAKDVIVVILFFLELIPFFLFFKKDKFCN